MKSLLKISAALLVVLVMVTESSVAQRFQNNRSQDAPRSNRAQMWNRGNSDGYAGMAGIPKLTDEQRDEIKSIRTSENKQALAINNQLKEKNAALNTLITADKYDSKAVDKMVDEISKLERDKTKLRLRYHQQIRVLLDDEQRLAFDTRTSRWNSGEARSWSNRGFRRHR